MEFLFFIASVLLNTDNLQLVCNAPLLVTASPRTDLLTGQIYNPSLEQGRTSRLLLLCTYLIHHHITCKHCKFIAKILQTERGGDGAHRQLRPRARGSPRHPDAEREAAGRRAQVLPLQHRVLKYVFIVRAVKW